MPPVPQQSRQLDVEHPGAIARFGTAGGEYGRVAVAADFGALAASEYEVRYALAPGEPARPFSPAVTLSTANGWASAELEIRGIPELAVVCTQGEGGDVLARVTLTLQIAVGQPEFGLMGGGFASTSLRRSPPGPGSGPTLPVGGGGEPSL